MKHKHESYVTMKRKIVKIYVTNEELHALEDIITAELSPEQFKECQALALPVWERLVKEFDKVVEYSK